MLIFNFSGTGKTIFPYIALTSVFAAQMALLGFIFPLFLTLPE